LIAFCDADDVLLPQHLEALVAVHDRHGGIATSNCYWLYPGGIDAARTRYKGRFPKEQRRAILEQNFVSTMSLFPRALLDEIGPFDTELQVAEDWDFWLRAIFAGQRVSLQSKPLALYRRGTGLSVDERRMDEHGAAVLRKALARDDLSTEERAYVKRRLAGAGPAELGRKGDDALRARDYGEAARRYKEAAALAPSEPALVWKARAMRLAPRLAGPLVRARQVRIENRTGAS
jgi:hypothetical protein